MPYRQHTTDIYGADVYLVTTAKQWRKLTGLLPFLDKEPPTAAGFTQFAVFEPNRGLNQPVIALFVDTKNHRGHGDLVDTLAHEAAHAAHELMKHIGHQVDGVDEPTAYLIGWLTRWMWGHVHREVATSL